MIVAVIGSSDTSHTLLSLFFSSGTLIKPILGLLFESFKSLSLLSSFLIFLIVFIMFWLVFFFFNLFCRLVAFYLVVP